MGKFKMPSVQHFLQKKTIYGPKKDPVWIYLEKEMRENVANKPYNDRVGNWLKFLRDLKYYMYRKAKKIEKQLNNEVGPAWYCELSSSQIEVLNHLKENIHQDLLEDLPTRIRKSLSDLGVTLKFPKILLMHAMNESINDPGVFIWNLYTSYYKRPPSELKPMYDINSMILMSCLVFIDLEECIETLEKLTSSKKAPPLEKPLRKNKYFQPQTRYGEYLQKMFVPCYSTHSSGRNKQKHETLDYKFRLRSEQSYERLCKDHSFLLKRKERNRKQKQVERICHYKFWEPPSTLRNSDPKMVAYVNKLRMFKKKAKCKHKSLYKNVQYLISGVSYTGGVPNYILTNVALLPTGYIHIHGGIVEFEGNFITVISGYWNSEKDTNEKCDATCDCSAKWESMIMGFIKNTKCNCGHLYDFYHEGKCNEKYFYPPTKHGQYWIDNAQIYQMDPTENFIKKTIKEALMSSDGTSEPTMPPVSADSLNTTALLAALLADLADTPLLIPHLPQANLLHNLLEWVRKRVKGNITLKQHKQMILKSQRRWLDLKHMDFRARAYRIPFTLNELEHINWSHRQLVQKLFKIMLNDFVTRNRMNQLEQTRLWWSTMKYDEYPSKAFLDIYFTYMPGRMKDVFLINPYSSELTPKHGAKTCPLYL
ncbi:hypothetical protein ACJJTC_013270 [Scirpophaga incertulas]